MQNLLMGHIISIVATLLLVALVGIYSGRKVKSAADFSTAGKKAGWTIVGGTIVGTLVGAASTVATSQMAFLYGFSAWWYTLGSGTGCLLLGVFMTKQLWNSNAKTVPEILSREYGNTASVCCSIIVCIALFLSVIPQVLALSALLSSMLKIGLIVATIISILLMIVYVVFGGVWGTGLAGVLKIILLYFSVILAGIVVTVQAGGVSGFQSMFPPFPWFSLWGKGVMSGLAGFVSAIIGVLSSQTYVQAVMSGKNVKAGRIGAVASFILIPPIGFVSVLIGLFMRYHFPEIASASAFPLFILHYINPWIGGIILATILISVIGTGAGVTLGISTILTNDLYKKLYKPKATDMELLKVSRIFIVLVLAATFIFTYGNLKSVMLKWTFLSMGLRGTAAFLPLVFALFLKGKVNKQAAILAMTVGPIGVLVWKIFNSVSKIDPVYIGIIIGAICMCIGLFVGRGKEKTENINA